MAPLEYLCTKLGGMPETRIPAAERAPWAAGVVLALCMACFSVGEGAVLRGAWLFARLFVVVDGVE